MGAMKLAIALLVCTGCSRFSPQHKRAVYIRDHHCKVVRAFPEEKTLSVYGNLETLKAWKAYSCPELGTWVAIYDDEEQP